MEKKYREPWEFPKGIDNFEDLITSGCVYVYLDLHTWHSE